jgi:uncharacterized repeat protein (TIGR03803 family)
LFTFDGADGASPSSALIQGTDGNLYGTAQAGGSGQDEGTVFQITPAGTLTTLYSFCRQSGCADGAQPDAALLQAISGDFYGTTVYGGDSAPDGVGGTVFKISPSGVLTTLYRFSGQSGYYPLAGLVQATNGDFYGTTPYGGSGGNGTIFGIAASGTLTTLYSFTGGADGGTPESGLLQAANGDFYGTTFEGGLQGGGFGSYGTVFKITPDGKLTTLYKFCSQGGSQCTDGAQPAAGLVEAINGDLYGTTEYGGAKGNDGTVFRITPSGALTTLHRFCFQSGCLDGISPAKLIQSTDGDFYGTTLYSGANHGGTVFKITPHGNLTTLYSFCAESGCVDGGTPVAGLVQATNGDFYGTASEGGANSYGTVFSLSVGLGPFVETQRTSGEVGKDVTIVGNNLTGATSVSFNGTPAAFTVNASGSAIATIVPVGASTGTVQVVTPGGTLLSNVPFRVLP